MKSIVLVFLWLTSLLYYTSRAATNEFFDYKKRYAPSSSAKVPPEASILKTYSQLSDIQKALFLDRYFSNGNTTKSENSILLQVGDLGINQILQIYPLQVLKQFKNIKTYEILVPKFTNPDDFISNLRTSFPNINVEKNIEIKSFESSTISSNALQIISWERLLNSIRTDLGPPKGKVKVGILDTGVENHIDLPRVSNASKDFNGHGTHVAGLISAIKSNQLGTDGITSEAILANYPVLDASGKGNLIDLIAGLIKAWKEDCKLIQLSIGTYEYSRILYDTLTFLANNNVVMVAAAGNDNSSQAALPAMHPLVIGVGSHDSNRNPSVFSNHGINQIVSLPGENIISTLPNNQFGPMTGTSMAAPLLSGILIELMSRRTTPLPVLNLVEVFALHASEVNIEGKSKHAPLDSFLFFELYKKNAMENL